MNDGQLRAALAVLRHREHPAAERAAAAAAIALRDEPAAVYPPSMFEYGARHAAAQPWDQRSARSGTITYVAPDRVEQYAGAGRWSAFATDRLARIPAVGDQVRIAAHAGGVSLEPIGPNRLAGTAAPLRTTGMTLQLDAAVTAGALDAIVAAVRDRHDGVALDAAGNAAFVRIEVAVDGDPLRAERAMLLCAAVLIADFGGCAADDVGAVYDADMLTALAARNATRADSFAFAAAAATQRWPIAPPENADVTLFFTAPHDAAEIAAAFADATAAWGNIEAAIDLEPVVPVAVEALLARSAVCACSLRSEPGAREAVMAIAAAIAHRRDALACDRHGRLYAPDDLVALALTRRGRAPSH